MASTYLSKTFAQAGNRRTFTISYWIKMNGFTSTNPGIFDAGADGSNSDDLYIHTGRLNFSGYYGSTQYQVRTTAKYRDAFGWYHHVIRFDTTQSTASDRLRLYVNGELQTALDNNTYPSQNFQTTYMNTARLHTIGSFAIGSLPNTPFDGLMSHFHFCDGYSYGADSFGETDSTTGEWKIKTSPSVSYGTNGFFILKDGNSVTDQSGQGNNWSVGGGTLTKTEDCPSNVFATLNPLNVPTSNTPSFSNGNTTSISSSSGGDNGKWGGCSTLGMTSGKFYCEAKATVDGTYSRNVIGVTGDPMTMARANNQSLLSNTGNSSGYYSENGQVNYNNSAQYTAATYTTGDIVQIAIDLDNNRLFYGKNGTWLNSGDPTSSTGAITIGAASTCPEGAYFFAQNDDTGTSAQSKFEFNFGNGYFGTTAVSSAGTNASGNGIFEYNVPTGYTALSTKGLNE